MYRCDVERVFGGQGTQQGGPGPVSAARPKKKVTSHSVEELLALDNTLVWEEAAAAVGRTTDSGMHASNLQQLLEGDDIRSINAAANSYMQGKSALRELMEGNENAGGMGSLDVPALKIVLDSRPWQSNVDLLLGGGAAELGAAQEDAVELATLMGGHMERAPSAALGPDLELTCSVPSISTPALDALIGRDAPASQKGVALGLLHGEREAAVKQRAALATVPVWGALANWTEQSSGQAGQAQQSVQFGFDETAPEALPWEARAEVMQVMASAEVPTAGALHQQLASAVTQVNSRSIELEDARAQVHMLHVLLETLDKISPAEERRARRKGELTRRTKEFLGVLSQPGELEEDAALKALLASDAGRQWLVGSEEEEEPDAAEMTPAECLLAQIEPIWGGAEGSLPEPDSGGASLSALLRLLGEGGTGEGAEVPSVPAPLTERMAAEAAAGGGWAEDVSRTSARRLLTAMLVEEAAQFRLGSSTGIDSKEYLRRLGVLPLPKEKGAADGVLTEGEVERYIEQGKALRNLLGGEALAQIRRDGAKLALPRGCRALAELFGEESALLQLDLPRVVPHAAYPVWNPEQSNAAASLPNGRTTAPRGVEHGVPHTPGQQSFGRTMRIVELDAEMLGNLPLANAAEGRVGPPHDSVETRVMRLLGAPLVVGDWLTVRVGAAPGVGHWSVAGHEPKLLLQQAPMHWLDRPLSQRSSADGLEGRLFSRHAQVVRFTALSGCAETTVELLLHKPGAVLVVRLLVQVVAATADTAGDARRE